MGQLYSYYFFDCSKYIISFLEFFLDRGNCVGVDFNYVELLDRGNGVGVYCNYFELLDRGNSVGVDFNYVELLSLISSTGEYGRCTVVRKIVSGNGPPKTSYSLIINC
jgi:hypothetical protein